MSTEREQLNLSLTEKEYEQIEEMAKKLGLNKKDLILQSIRKSQEHLSNEEPDPHITDEVKECMESADGLFGFDMKGLIKDLENHGLQWLDLCEADLALIIGRYKEHAEWWSYSSAHVKEDLGQLAKTLAVDEKTLLRRYYAPQREKEEEPSEPSDAKDDINETGQTKGG